MPIIIPANPTDKGVVADQRFELLLSQRLCEGLRITAEKEGISKADVVRRALGLYARTLEAEGQGQLIGFASIEANGSPRVVELIRLHGGSAPPQQIQQEDEARIGGLERFELRLSKALDDGVVEMAEKEGISKADVVRRALGLYARALEASAKGQIIAFANLHEGNVVNVVELIKIR
jgi:predicted HicB family RNase H-like nuclease